MRLPNSFFFLRRPAAAFLLHRAKRTDLLVDRHQLLAELLPALKFRNLPLGLAQSGRSGKTLVDGLPLHFATQTKLGLVPGVVRLGTVATGFPAAAYAGGNRTRSEITQAEELLQDISAFLLQIAERFWHKAFWHMWASGDLRVMLLSDYDPKKEKPAINYSYVARTGDLVTLTSIRSSCYRHWFAFSRRTRLLCGPVRRTRGVVQSS